MKKVLFLLASLLAFNANAADIFAECGYCDSYYDFESAAKTHASTTGKSRSEVIIRNRNTNQEWKFTVISLRAEPGVPANVTVVNSEFTLAEKDLLNRIKQQESLIADLFDTYQRVPESIATSAYDLVDNTSLQNAVANYYLANQSIQQALGNYSSLIVVIAGKLVGITLSVEVIMSDGSVINYQIVGLDGKSTLALAVLNAVDSNGNNISMTKAGLVSGSKDFTGPEDVAFREFSEAITRLGIPIYYSNGGTGGGSGGGSSSFECKWVGEVYQCTKKQS
ncbi:hypothetical protein [Shewanella mangrovisoli]|uniref:hypothetical protein n=1 Tax=Shewanella mangrovisoli TaxID=2864211 RepID=UPI0035B8188A